MTKILHYFKCTNNHTIHFIYIDISYFTGDCGGDGNGGLKAFTDTINIIDFFFYFTSLLIPKAHWAGCII